MNDYEYEVYEDETYIQKLERVAAAAEKLNRKMIHVYETDEYNAVWSLYWSHMGDYKGEKWQDEQSELQAALEDLK